MNNATKKAIETEVNAKIAVFTNALTTTATELPAIVAYVAEGLTLILQDKVIVEKIQNTATVYGKIVSDFTHAYLDMFMAIEEEVGSYDGLMKGYALRHPLNVKPLHKIDINIKKGWDNIAKAWFPEPTQEEVDNQFNNATGVDIEENGPSIEYIMAVNKQIDVFKDKCINKEDYFDITILNKALDAAQMRGYINDEAYRYMLMFHCADWKEIPLTKSQVAFTFGMIATGRVLPTMAMLLTK